MVKPETKIRVMENSLSCFRCGAASLIPLIGIPFLVRAIRCRHQVWLNSNGVWNPAKYHVMAGFLLAWLGGLVNMISLILLLMALGKLVLS